MQNVPKTSESLLIALGADSKSVRWREFVEKYTPVMRGYLRNRFPKIDHDEVIQRTFLAFVNTVKNYRYEPEATGLFHNYLIGMLRYKALSYCDEIKNDLQHKYEIVSLSSSPSESDAGLDIPDSDMRYSAYELALREVFADPVISTQSKEVFRRVAIAGESPESVASAFGITRNNVDQIKSRVLARLKKIIDNLLP